MFWYWFLIWLLLGGAGGIYEINQIIGTPWDHPIPDYKARYVGLQIFSMAGGVLAGLLVRAVATQSDPMPMLSAVSALAAGIMFAGAGAYLSARRGAPAR